MAGLRPGRRRNRGVHELDPLRRKARHGPRAEMLLPAGHYLWNAGMFLFARRTLIAPPFDEHAPGTCRGGRDGAGSGQRRSRLHPDRPRTPGRRPADISIDYAIMEKADNVAVMPFGGGWSDLGGWDAVWQESGPDADGNVCSDHATAIDCTEHACCARRPTGCELVGIGLKNIVAIAMRDAVLVADKSRSAERARRPVMRSRPRVPTRRVQLPRRLPPLGLVRKPGHRRAVPGQAHRGAIPVRRSACKAITTAPSTGSWWRAPRR